jgi:hypothetical protein
VEHAVEDRLAMAFARIPKNVARCGAIAAKAFVWGLYLIPHQLLLLLLLLWEPAVVDRLAMVNALIPLNVARRLACAAHPLRIAEAGTRALK